MKGESMQKKTRTNNECGPSNYDFFNISISKPRRKTYSYLKLQEVMSENNGTSAWIFVTDALSYFNPADAIMRTSQKLWSEANSNVLKNYCDARFVCLFEDRKTKQRVVIFSKPIDTVCSYQMQDNKKIFSKKAKKRAYNMIVHCDMMDSHVLRWMDSSSSSSMSKNRSVLHTYISTVKHFQSKILNSDFTSDITVTVFDIYSSRYLQYTSQVNSIVTMFPNVTAAVCSTYRINDAKTLYRHDPAPLSNASHQRPLRLGLCALVNLLLEQWIEYYIFHGFEHFYLYDHTWHSPNGSSTLYSSLNTYIDKKVVVYIKYHVPGSTLPHSNWYFQHTQINSCLQRFRHDNTFLAIIDVDEWIVPNTLLFHSLRSHYSIDSTPVPFATIRHVIDLWSTQFHVNYFEMYRYIGSTCVENITSMTDCQTYKFHTFLQRHQCVFIIEPMPKAIVDPLVVDLMWIHVIDRQQSHAIVHADKPEDWRRKYSYGSATETKQMIDQLSCMYPSNTLIAPFLLHE
ncbi:glycosyl transferase, family 2 [Reticulomyxa filosa]|uniref:Glycosyl transferase, family 2 n=1 Tax=Reticulomyxa filosa TaxID=46433 RepID=X6M686_RETFI|nr:glycosyl transferase, family 2 [Reticulomyxa filosa]|eukprot:ETO08972.1 glycosyl transferase, family 2 [Reticulomyxa filosa]